MNSDETPNNELNPEFWKDVYANPDNLVELKFYNRTDHVKYLWVEPNAISIELDLNTEYKIVTHERGFDFEYTSEHQMSVWMDRSFGFKLYKRPHRDINAPADWELEMDSSDINW